MEATRRRETTGNEEKSSQVPLYTSTGGKPAGKTNSSKLNPACIRAIRDATEVSKAHNEALEVLEVAEDIIRYATKNG